MFNVAGLDDDHHDVVEEAGDGHVVHGVGVVEVVQVDNNDGDDILQAVQELHTVVHIEYAVLVIRLCSNALHIQEV